MDKLIVTNIQRLCVNDGPGVRTVVFLRGCSLQCPWCCNPETIHTKSNDVFDKGICTYPDKKLYCKDFEKYEGERKIIDCPIHAYKIVSSKYLPNELLDELSKEQYIYPGGITFSGGEPLLQIDALISVLRYLKKNNISIAFESTLYVPVENLKKALPYVDYWLIDLKFQYRYIINKEFEVPTDAVYDNIHLLQQSVSPNNVNYRIVMMHEIVSKIDNIIIQLLENHIKSIDLLEYHSLAENKYRQLGMPFHRFEPLTEDDVQNIHKLLIANNIESSYVRI